MTAQRQGDLAAWSQLCVCPPPTTTTTQTLPHSPFSPWWIIDQRCCLMAIKRSCLPSGPRFKKSFGVSIRTAPLHYTSFEQISYIYNSQPRRRTWFVFTLGFEIELSLEKGFKRVWEHFARFHTTPAAAGAQIGQKRIQNNWTKTNIFIVLLRVLQKHKTLTFEKETHVFFSPQTCFNIYFSKQTINQESCWLSKARRALFMCSNQITKTALFIFAGS